MPAYTNRQLYARLLSYLKHVRKYVALLIFSMLLTAATEPLLPIIMERLVDGSLIAKNQADILYLPLAMLLLFVVRGLADYFSRVSAETLAQHSIERMRNQLFSRINEMPLTKIDQMTSGGLISKFTFDVNQMAQALSQSWVILIRDSLVVIALLSYLIYLSWVLSITLLIVAPIAGFIINKASLAMRKHSNEAQEDMANMTHVLEENIDGLKEIKLFGAHPQEQRRFQSASQAVRQQLLKINLVTALNVPLVQVVAACSIVVILYMASTMANQDALTPGNFVAYITATALLFEPLRQLTHVNPQIQQGLAAANSIFTLLDTQPEINNGTYQKPLKGNITFHNIQFTYPNAATPAIQSFNLTISQNETVAIVGASGSGKTTLINLLTRFYTPQQGNITIDGIPLDDIELSHLRNQIGLVSQHVFLLNDSIQNNIAYGSNQHQPLEAVKKAAKQAYAHDFIEQLKDQYQTIAGTKGGRLSGGQRQRIAIARTFLKEAPILLLDEASSALDNTSEKHIKQAIEAVSKNRTTIIIAHRLTTIQNADRIIVMAQGKIVEQGTHEQLLNNQGTYTNLYQQNQSKT